MKPIESKKKSTSYFAHIPSLLLHLGSLALALGLVDTLDLLHELNAANPLDISQQLRLRVGQVELVERMSCQLARRALSNVEYLVHSPLQRCRYLA
jgi:hypothetical protein